MTVVKKMRADVAQARKTALALAVSIAEGKQVSDKQIESTRRAADLGVLEFATLVETLESRKQASDTYHATDYSAAREANLAERRKLGPEIQAKQAELEAMRVELRNMQERLNSLTSQHSHLDRQQKEAGDAMRAVLKASGGQSDWRDITLF